MPDLPRLARTTEKPLPGIVHLGPGAFFRAFNALYTDDAMAAQGGDWGIIAVSLRSAGPRDQLAPQQGVFTAVERAPEGARYRQVSSVVDCLVAPEDPEKVLDAMSAETTRIVSMTVTEKGYCHDPATGELSTTHPDIQHDLAQPDQPKSAPGFLVEALSRRKARGLKPFTVLTCDNLPSNGRLLRNVVLALARLRDAGLADWIEAEARFPATMVDRITPATTAADIDELAAEQGYRDAALVVHEPFRQWVIEDDFVSGRPAWDVVGAQLVANVEPYELMKLRCLNGTHSSLAYLGYLAGFETIAKTVSDPAFASFCQKLWAEEIVPTVPAPPGQDLAAYTTALMARYRNPAIRHLTWQIAMDGSQKLPQRLLGTIADNMNRGHTPRGLCLAVAAWMRYVGGTDETGAPIDVWDPMAPELRAVTQDNSEPASRVDAYLRLSEVFDPALAQNAAFRQSVTEAYSRLLTQGAKNSVEHVLKE